MTTTIAPRPVEVFEAQRLNRHFSEGMERNYRGEPREACRNDKERRGWDVAQSMKEL